MTRVLFIVLISFIAILTACDETQTSGGRQSDHEPVARATPIESNASRVLVQPSGEKPEEVVVYADVTSSVDGDALQNAIDGFVSGLEKNSAHRIAKIHFVYFGAGPIGIAEKKTFALPVRTGCQPVNYDELPGELRNLEVYRSELEKKHRARCDEAAAGFEQQYKNALEALAKELKQPPPSSDTRCTNHGRLAERIRSDMDDLSATSEVLPVLISDLRYDCETKEGKWPLRIRGVIIRLAPRVGDDSSISDDDQSVEDGEALFPNWIEVSGNNASLWLTKAFPKIVKAD